MILTDIELENEYTDRNDDLNFVVWNLLGIDGTYRPGYIVHRAAKRT